MSKGESFRFLVVEDEPDIAAVVAYQLTRAGHNVRTASTGAEALRIIEIDPPDLVILDLMLPGMNGLDMLRTLRESEETKALPVVVLTARGEEKDRLAGFELGADDYVTKPFSPRELVLRAEAVARRSGYSESGDHPRSRLVAGPFVMDVSAHRVTVGGEEVKLTRKEFRLLEVFIRRRGRTQSRKSLLETVWETAADIETRTVDMHVRRLRAKLGAYGHLIETVRGFGYRLRAED